MNSQILWSTEKQTDWTRLRKILQLINSELKMDVESVFKTVIRNIQSSNLNYRINLSPFSASISLKKSFIKDRNGNCLFPKTPESAVFKDSKSKDCEDSRIINLNRELEAAISDFTDISEKHAALEAENVKLKNQVRSSWSVAAEVNNNDCKLHFDSYLESLKRDIEDLKVSNETKRQTINRLNTETVEHREKLNKKLTTLQKNYRMR